MFFSLKSFHHFFFHLSKFLLSAVILVSCGKGDEAMVLRPPPFLKQFGLQAMESSAFLKSSEGVESCEALVIDRHGSAICAGYTNSSFAETKGGGFDAVVMKLQNNGELLWVKQIGKTTQDTNQEVINSSGDDFCLSVAVDDDQNIYCAGRTQGNLADSNNSRSDAFIMKIHSSGELMWIRQLGQSQNHFLDSSQNDMCLSVAVDEYGHVYCGGQTQSSLGEDHGGGYDAFVWKLDSEGNFIWLRQIGQQSQTHSSIISTSHDEVCMSVKVDQKGNVYCGGHTTGSFADELGGISDGFVLKLSPSGNLLWARQLGKNFSQQYTQVKDVSGVELVSSLVLDQNGSLYLGGHSNGEIQESHQEDFNIFILKMNLEGDLEWLTHFGLESKDFLEDLKNIQGDDFLRGMKMTNDGLILSGNTTSQMIGNNQNERASDHQDNDIFLMKINKSGDLMWLKQLGDESQKNSYLINDTQGNDYCRNLDMDQLGNIFCAGHTDGDLGETNAGASDIIMIKFNFEGRL